MKCEEVKLEFPGLLWGELSEQEREKVLKHLSGCESCRLEWKELKAAEAVMTELPDEDPPSDLVFVAPPSKSGLLVKFWEWINTPGVQRWGFAAAMVLIGLAIAKPSLTIGSGGFNLAFGSPPVQNVQLTESAIERRLQTDRLETLKMVSDVIQQASEEQRRDYTLTLASFARDLERQRQQDVDWMQTGMTNIQRSSQTGIMKTNKVLEDIIKTAGYQRTGGARNP